MKIVSIGDIHGSSAWKNISIKENDADKFVFIGDYFDSHNGGYSPNRQIENFKDILEFKRQNPNKVILLIGNHDFHYLNGTYETYSKYQAGYSNEINKLLEGALSEGLMQMCFVEGNFVFTHAGVTKTWVENNDIDVSNLESSINSLFNTKRTSFCFSKGPNFSKIGDDVTQSPIWVRPVSLNEDMIDNVICVVGHTRQQTICRYGNIVLTDCLHSSGDYLIVNNGIVSVGYQ